MALSVAESVLVHLKLFIQIYCVSNFSENNYAI